MKTRDCETAVPGTKVWDKGAAKSVKGLYLRVSLKGVRRWYCYYRTRQGQQRNPKLGEYPTLSLDQARTAASKILAEVAAGGDPVGTWKRARNSTLIRDLYDRCREREWKGKAWYDQAHVYWEKHIAPTFASTRVENLTTTRIRAWHAGIDSPYSANRSLSVLSRAISSAIETGVVREDFRNPCAGIRRRPEQKRERFATREELVKLKEILDQDLSSPRPATRRAAAFILLLLYTGARPSIIERARVQDLGEDGVLRVKGKSGMKDPVVIPEQGRAVLRKLWFDDRYVDRQTQKPADPLTGLKNLPRDYWARVRKEIGAPDLRARDLRRTWATVGMSFAALPAGRIGEALNHRSAQTTKIYSRLAAESRIETAKTIADQIDHVTERTNNDRDQVPPPPPPATETQ